MDLCILSEAGINVDEGLARFRGNQELYERMLLLFPEDANYSELCLAIAQKRTRDAFVAAHTLKGLTGNFSMTRLYADLCPLVDELRGGSLALAEELLRPVTLDYDRIVSVLNEAT